MGTRERIVDEATSQLLDLGYASFTMAAVRDALGISTGSMFHAFGSKSELGAEVFVRGMRDYQTVAAAALQTGPSPAEAIGAFVSVHLGWVQDHRRLAHFLFMTQPPELLEAAATPLASANEEFYAVIAEVLDAAAADGLCRQLDVAIGHPLIVGPAQEYCRRWTRGLVDVAPRDTAALFQDAALAALRSTLIRSM